MRLRYGSSEVRTRSLTRAGLTALLLGALAAALLALAPSVGARSRRPLDVDTFARVPSPGQPEGIVVAPNRDVYVGTDNNGPLPPQGPVPSRIFRYRPDGRLVRSFVIRGQNRRDPAYGLLGLTMDGDGLLYSSDVRPARIVRLDPRTGSQATYVRFPDVPPCRGRRRVQCSATAGDAPPFPNDPVFAPDGSLYVTDFQQALVWRVPPGGGRAEIFFTDPRLESAFGPNGLRLRADGRTFLLAQSVVARSGRPGPSRGRLYTLPIRSDGRPGRLRQLYESRPGDFPDGFALARSGRIYLALAGANQVAVLSPAGRELARTPSTPAQNALMDPPFDAPASVAFLGERALVTNHSVFNRNPRDWAVLDVFTGERGLPLFRPSVGEASTRRPSGGRTIDGTSGDDVLVGSDRDDVIRCGSGNDRVDGRGGDDVIRCGSGDDRVDGGSGDDRVDGDSGNDVVAGGTGDDRLFGGSGDDRVSGGPGRDRANGGSGRDAVSD